MELLYAITIIGIFVLIAWGIFAAISGWDIET